MSWQISVVATQFAGKENSVKKTDSLRNNEKEIKYFIQKNANESVTFFEDVKNGIIFIVFWKE